jgi:hypothetical protein
MIITFLVTLNTNNKISDKPCTCKCQNTDYLIPLGTNIQQQMYCPIVSNKNLDI